MHLIFYSSKSTMADDEVEENLAAIVESCTRHNKADGVTGVLFYENRYFVQALEGEEAAVRETFDRVKRDTRHTDVKLLVDEPIEERSFPDWAMDTFFVRHPELVDSDMIALIHKIYERSFPINTKDLVDFHKKMVDEVDTFKILRFEN